MNGPWERFKPQEEESGPWSKFAAKQAEPAKGPEKLPETLQIVRDTTAGLLLGAGSIGSTLLAPYDMAKDALAGKGLSLDSNRQRRAQIEEGLQMGGADPSSMSYQGGKLGAEVAGTAGIGGALAKGVQAIPAAAPYAAKVSAALQSGGMNLGAPAATTLAGKVGDAATRLGAGAVTGGAMAGAVDPADAGLGAAIGGAMPAAVKAGGMLGGKLAKDVSPAVVDLYNKAKALGIDIPADRIANSRPMNAIASSLNYVPFSGRAATEEKMLNQMNQALSRTFGQDSPNVTMALRKAGTDLGGEFEKVLQANTVKVDNQWLNELADHSTRAANELGAEGARVINNQIDEILRKAPNGVIDGQAAYNIKKTLDRIGRRNSPEAYYATDLKKTLMEALNRSLGKQEAAAFASTRKQYSNMLSLEKLAQNGAEGGVSVGRLANLKNINNPELQDLADIASQFIKTRENPHGAAQRIGLALGGGAIGSATGTLPLVAAGMAGARGVNSVLNSSTLKSLMLNGGQPSQTLMDLLSNPVFRATPAAISATP